MVRKLKDLADKYVRGTTGLLDTPTANAVKDSAQQIWFAGMGAFAKTQQEGTRVFESLVQEGMNLQRKSQGIAEDKIHEVTGRMSAMAETVSARAGENWGRLESLFEQRTAKAMGKLGVPSAADLDALTKRVDALAAAVARLSKAPRAAAAKAAAKKATPVKKASARRVTPKQAA